VAVALAELRAKAADAPLDVYTLALACPAATVFKKQKTRREDAMALADLKNVLNIFGGSDIDEEQQNELFKEVLLMTLARAADADINIQSVEVERVRDIIREYTGEEVSAKDVRVAARAELYAEAELRKYLSKVRGKMKPAHRADTIQALADVFRSDHVVSPLEVDFFDRVAESLGVTASQVAGLEVGEVPRDAG